MKIRARKYLNSLLLLLVISLAGTAGYLLWVRLEPAAMRAENDSLVIDSLTDTLLDNMEHYSLDSVKKGAHADISVTGIGGVEELPERRRDIHVVRTSTIGNADITSFKSGHPFYGEARKILSGGLEEPDSLNRRGILNYCEHLRTAYTTRDIDFIRQVFSDNALIIVGHTVKTGASRDMSGGSTRVRYSIHSKASYLERLEKVFASNKRIDVRFSDFKIMRHPTMEGIYGVTLRQNYASDRYADDGYLFLLWDFRQPEMPRIHVRTWQPEEYLSGGEDVIGLSDFNLE